MKIKCSKCKRKFFVEVDENGIPKRNVCNRCRVEELKRILKETDFMNQPWEEDKKDE